MNKREKIIYNFCERESKKWQKEINDNSNFLSKTENEGFYNSFNKSNMKKLIKIPEYYRNYPNNDCLMTRDTSNIDKSCDFLFLSSILKLWDDSISHLSVFVNDEKSAFLLITDYSNNHYYPFSGKYFETSGLFLKKTIDKITLKSKILKDFFSLRNSIINNDLLGSSVYISEMNISLDGEIIDHNVLELNNSLSWNFENSKDLYKNMIEFIDLSSCYKKKYIK